MRNAFAQEVTKLAHEDERVVLLSGDIGNKLFDNLKKIDHKRVLNCGVAEANMIGMAAGLAMCGFRPIVYTITPFATTRCLEQIRDDVCYHDLPVIIVGTGAGLSYSELGPTHHSCEDIALLRVLPGMTVLAPCDKIEVQLALRAAFNLSKPVYMRIGKKGEPVIHKNIPSFSIGKSITLKEGKEICFLSTGNMMPVVMEVALKFDEKGITSRVDSMHTIKPLDIDCLTMVFSNYKLVVAVEEHSKLGGLGGAIAEWIVSQPPLRARFLAFGTEDWFLHESGSQDYARGRYGLTTDNIFQKSMELFKTITRQ